MDKQPLGLLNNPEKKTLFILSPLRHTTELVLLIYLFPFFPRVRHFLSVSSFRISFGISSVHGALQFALHEFKQYYRRVSSFIHIDGPCTLYEPKTLKQSHQTFKMISFKPIMAINLWMEYDRIALRTTERACTMRFSFWWFLICFLCILTTTTTKNTKNCGVVNLVKNAFE